MGLHGNPLGLTPNLDRLATRGTFAANAFTCQPLCAPARSVLQTGQYPTVNGVVRNGIALGPQANTLAHEFTKAGYRTAYIGKWHLAGNPKGPAAPENRGGYDYWLAIDAAGLYSDAYDAKLFDGAGELHHLPGYRADAYIDAAIDWICGRDSGSPFLLFVGLVEPHHTNRRDDYPAPDGYKELYEGRWTPDDLAALGGNADQSLGGYWGMIKRVDEALGRLLDVLRTEGIRDDTIIAMTSDHGCHFKTRNREYKRTEHEASIRVPMAVSGPGFDNGGRIDELVSLIDLPPTLLDAAGLPVPDQMQGHSFMPLLKTAAADWPQEVFIQISESHVGRALRTHRWKYAVTAPDADVSRDAEALRYVESSLYDLDADPYELTNLVGLADYASIAAELRSRLIARMVEAGEDPPEIIAASRSAALEPGASDD